MKQLTRYATRAYMMNDFHNMISLQALFNGDFTKKTLPAMGFEPITFQPEDATR